MNREQPTRLGEIILEEPLLAIGIALAAAAYALFAVVKARCR